MTAGRPPQRRMKIGGQFAPRLVEMISSPAFCVLSLSARRVLDRLEIEAAGHGGTENGKLIVTFDQFQRFGIDRHAIAPAIRETVALGFVEVTVSEGSELMREWGDAAPQKLAVVRERMWRIKERLNDADDAVLGEWFDALEPAEAKGVFALLAG